MDENGVRTKIQRVSHPFRHSSGKKSLQENINLKTDLLPRHSASRRRAKVAADVTALPKLMEAAYLWSKQIPSPFAHNLLVIEA